MLCIYTVSILTLFLADPISEASDLDELEQLDSPRVHRVKHKSRCYVCGRKFADIAQHYYKSHKAMTKSVRLYLLDCRRHFNRSGSCKDPVNDRSLCLRRFVNPTDHSTKGDRKNRQVSVGLRDHFDNDVTRINNPKDPNEMTEFIRDEISQLREPKVNGGILLEYFVRDQVKKACRKNNSTNAVHKRFTKTFQHHLNKLWVTTGQFRRHENASKLIEEVKKNGNYKASSMVVFIVVLKKYLRYIRKNQKQMKLPYDVWMDVLSGDYRHQMKKDQVLLQNKKKSQTPSPEEWATMLQCVTDHLDSPTVIKNSYHFLKGLVFFYFHALSGTRPGPILNLTFDQYAPLRRGEIVYSTEHKTGAQYAVKFELTVKQIPWFDQMYVAFRKKTGTEPAYLFPTTFNQKEKSIARFVKDSLSEIAPRSLLNKQFNPTAIGRVLSTYMFGHKESNTHLYQAHLMQTAHQDRTETRHYVMDLVNSGSVMHEYGKLFRLPTEKIRTIPAHVNPQEFNEMAKSTIYLNTSNDGPVFPDLYPDQNKPGPSSFNVREDLAASFPKLDEESDMDEEDVTAIFEVQAHQQHMDAFDDDSDLEAEEMARYLEDAEDDPDDPDKVFSNLDENVSVLFASRKSQSFVPERRRGEFIASLNKFSGRINWKAEEKGLLLIFAQAKTTPSKTEIQAALRDKTGKNPTRTL